jgi:S1-C subfamily serine protease
VQHAGGVFHQLAQRQNGPRLIVLARSQDSYCVSDVQTTAPISPGSSGGGLFDQTGKLIGITTFKRAGKSDEGLSFAAPVQPYLELARQP